MNRFIDVMIEKYKLFFVIIMLFTLPLGYYYTQQTTLNHIDVFFEKDDPDLNFYKKFQETYGNEEMGVIVFKDKSIFSLQNIEIIRKISTMIKETEGIQRVLSLSEIEVPRGNEDMVSFEKIIPDGDLNEQMLSIAKENAFSHDLVTQSLISNDGTTTAIIIELESISSNMKKRELLTQIMNSAKEIAGNAVTLHFSGTPFIEVEINDLTRRDNFKFAPITLAIILLIVTFLFRKISLSILTLLNICLIEIWGIGFFTSCGEAMNMVTVIIPPVLMAIAVADSIHILAHYREIYMSSLKGHAESVAESIKALWLPCLFTSLTTGIGFLSFIITSVRPVKTVGIYSAIGVMFAFALTVTFLPVALMFLKKILEKDKPVHKILQKMGNTTPEASNPMEMQKNKSIFTRILINIGNFTINNSKMISIVAGIILVVGVVGMTKLEYETNFANYLPDKNNIKKDITFIEENFGGTVPVEMLIRAKSEKFDFTHPHSLKMLEDIQRELLEFNGQYSRTFSIADYIKEINKAFKNGKEEAYTIPETRIDVVDYYELGDEDTLLKMVSSDKMEARISLFSHLESSKKTKENSIIIDDIIEKKIGRNYTYNLTGSSPLYMVMDKNLRKSQFSSFFSALILIFIMMCFIGRNLKLTIISMIPNLFPIICTLGIMGWLKIPLDVSTIMIASVTIGIAVDDTIHFLVWFRRNALSGMDIKSSLLKTYMDAGKPIVITSVVLCATYLVLISGSVTPIIAFGILASLAMAFALIGDLLVFPALILVFKPEIETQKQKERKRININPVPASVVGMAAGKGTAQVSSR